MVYMVMAGMVCLLFRSTDPNALSFAHDGAGSSMPAENRDNGDDCQQFDEREGISAVALGWTFFVSDGFMCLGWIY
ncbi:MAG: hypothetical protein M2R45_01633 [Verrucomicrobia subdivision 3 bacterium]|nr:hypothetical protein [Limisphaerales bacterium]MCS1412784.1 hypothetical protein [Limisphaerales bacterium]